MYSLFFFFLLLPATATVMWYRLCTQPPTYYIPIQPMDLLFLDLLLPPFATHVLTLFVLLLRDDDHRECGGLDLATQRQTTHVQGAECSLQRVLVGILLAGFVLFTWLWPPAQCPVVDLQLHVLSGRHGHQLTSRG